MPLLLTIYIQYLANVEFGYYKSAIDTHIRDVYKYIKRMPRIKHFSYIFYVFLYSSLQWNCRIYRAMSNIQCIPEIIAPMFLIHINFIPWLFQFQNGLNSIRMWILDKLPSLHIINEVHTFYFISGIFSYF